MAIYSIAQRTTNVTNGQCSMDVGFATGTPRPKVMEWSITLAAATASTYGINRTTAIGTRTTPAVLQLEDPADAVPAGIQLLDSAIAHSVQPTAAAVYMRRIALPATIGTGYIWTFPEGLTIAVSGTIALFNLATNGVIDSSVVVRL